MAHQRVAFMLVVTSAVRGGPVTSPVERTNLVEAETPALPIYFA